MIVRVQNITLTKLAVQYYGDASQWIRIAEANGLLSPFITQMTDITIPDLDPNAPKGVPYWNGG